MANILGLNIGDVIEHDIARSASSSFPGQQSAKDRIIVEAREAPPNNLGSRINERGDTAVSDDGEIKPIIIHSAAVSPSPEIRTSQPRTASRFSKCPSTPENMRPTENASPSKSPMISKTELIRDVVADEYRAAVAKWRVAHQFTHPCGLAKSDLLDFQNGLAAKKFDRYRRIFQANLDSGFVHYVAQFRRQKNDSARRLSSLCPR